MDRRWYGARLWELYWYAENPDYKPETLQQRGRKNYSSEAKRRKIGDQTGGSGTQKKADIPEYRDMIHRDVQTNRLCAKGLHRCQYKDAKQIMNFGLGTASDGMFACSRSK